MAAKKETKVIFQAPPTSMIMGERVDPRWVFAGFQPSTEGAQPPPSWSLTNIAPEKVTVSPNRKGKRLPTTIFQGRTVKLRGSNVISKKQNPQNHTKKKHPGNFVMILPSKKSNQVFLPQTCFVHIHQEPSPNLPYFQDSLVWYTYFKKFARLASPGMKIEWRSGVY